MTKKVDQKHAQEPEYRALPNGGFMIIDEYAKWQEKMERLLKMSKKTGVHSKIARATTRPLKDKETGG